MSADVLVGDTWTLTSSDGLGVGFGAIPEGAEVVVDDVLPPFAPGVAQIAENTVCCVYAFPDYVYDVDGVLIEGENSRRLAFSESDFLSVFSPPGGGA